jgi:hypothetical protein
MAKSLSINDPHCVRLASLPQTLNQITVVLRGNGYCSKRGHDLTETHVSHFRVNDLGIRIIGHRIIKR